MARGTSHDGRSRAAVRGRARTSWGIVLALVALAGGLAFKILVTGDAWAPPGPRADPEPVAARNHGELEGALQPRSVEDHRLLAMPSTSGTILVGSTTGDLVPWNGAGRLTLRPLAGTEVAPREVAVRNGRFEIPWPREGTSVLVVEDVVLDRRVAVPLEPRALSASDRAVTVRALWARALTLEVLDESGSPLPFVEVRRSRALAGRSRPSEALWDPFLPPAGGHDGSVRLAEGPSPVAIGTLLADAVLHVGAPGHLWRAVEVDAGAAGRLEVVLPEAASLTVGLSGARPPEETFVRLYRAAAADHRGPSLEVPARDGLHVDRIPPGGWVVRVEEGLSWNRSWVLAEGEIALAAGEAARIGLALPPAGPRRLAHLELWVRCAQPARTWETPPLVLDPLDPNPRRHQRRLRLGAAQLRRVESNVLAPAEGPLELWPGRYRVTAEPLGLVWDVDVPPGDSRIAIEVPERRERVVLVVDGVSGAPVEPRWIAFAVALPGNGGQGRRALLERRTSPGSSFPLELPAPGILHASLEADGYGLQDLDLSVPDSPDDVLVLELQPRVTLLVQAFRAGQRVPMDRTWLDGLRIEGPGGGARRILSRSHRNARPATAGNTVTRHDPGATAAPEATPGILEARLTVEAGGPLTLRPAPWKGRPLPPLVVEGRGGTVVPVSFDLD